MSKITVVIPLAPKVKIESLPSIKKQKKRLSLIIKEGNNPSSNRNKGAEKARTPYIAFINSHTILSQEWSEKVESFFKNHPEVDIVGGPHLSMKGDSKFAQISSYALSSIFGVSAVRYRYKKGAPSFDVDETSLTSANLICRKEVLKKIKFDEKIYPGEDPKFITDAKAAGFRVAYDPEIVVYNRRRSNLSALAKQIFNYGKTRPRKESLLQTIKKPYFLVPSLFVIYLILLPFLAISSPILTFPLIAYIVLSLLFSLYYSLKNKNPLAFVILPVIFLAIHLSYGIGFIYGTIFPKK
ncbi:glycosyltransferase [Candidatus Pacearchaeota archaeon]|nr:glycosyltransferase [Candidatus Pacearchaeota archaeon]